MATSAAASVYDLVNPKIGTTVPVVMDAAAGQSWPLSAPATLWLAIGVLGLIVGLRGVRAARRLGEQRPGHQQCLTDAAALRGEMSLVGPRPQVSAEVAQYGAKARRRLLVRPGITGLWQVSGRSNVSWNTAVQLDLHYVENWSLAADLVILRKTAQAVLNRTGAY